MIYKVMKEDGGSWVVLFTDGKIYDFQHYNVSLTKDMGLLQVLSNVAVLQEENPDYTYTVVERKD